MLFNNPKNKIKNKFDFRLVLFIIIVFTILLSFFSYRFISSRQLNNLSSWKSYEDKQIKIKFSYPPAYYIKYNNQVSSISKHLYIYSDKNDEIARIHYYPKLCDEIDKKFKIVSININGTTWQLALYPKGLDSGDYKLTTPILYFITCHNEDKYSLQFNNRLVLDNIQTRIVNSILLK